MKKPRYNLIPAAMKRSVQDFIDFDYLHKLSPEELDWLNKFCAEFYSGRFSKTEKNLHAKKVKRREVWTTDNARRRDVWTTMYRLYINTDTLSERELHEVLDER